MKLCEELRRELKSYASARKIIMHKDVFEAMKLEEDNEANGIKGLVEWFPEQNWTFDQVPIEVNTTISRWAISVAKGKITLG